MIHPNTLALLTWYEKNKRNLPFRGSNDPWVIWLSEVIFQQTRIEQGMSYFHTFIDKYPTVHNLAKAPEDEVLKLWQGLGYYARARNLIQGAKQIAEKGQFPDNFSAWKEIKGVGPYTAAAISSIVFKEKVPVLDGNVKRVISRWLGLEELINSKPFERSAWPALLDMMGDAHPGTFNQAMMELGSMICKPQKPVCQECPLNSTCFAFLQKKVAFFPNKEKKKPVKDRYFQFLVIEWSGSTYIKKREGKDIWQGLHQFPLIEEKSPIDWSSKAIFSSHPLKGIFQGEWKTEHLLTHQRLYINIRKILLKRRPEFLDSHIFEVPVEKLSEYGFPIILARLIPDFFKPL